MSDLALALVVPALLAPLILIVLLMTPRRRSRAAWLFLALLALDIFVTTLPIVIPHPWTLHKNWIGKLLSIGWALVFMKVGAISAKEIGLTTRQRPGTTLWSAGACVVLVVATAFLVGPERGASTSTLFFEATLPGMAEELAYRGIFLALLVDALGKDRRAQVIASVVTSLAFGLWHGLAIESSHLTFNTVAFVLPFVGGLAFAAMRVYSGSLVWPVLTHNAANCVGYVVAMFGRS